MRMNLSEIKLYAFCSYIEGPFLRNRFSIFSCDLLNEFKNEEFAEKYYFGPRNFDLYILKSKTYIYNEATHKRFKHFELIEFLYKSYPEAVTKEINNLKKLTDDKIQAIVGKIPDNLLTDKHKEYIIIYLKKRRNLLFDIINGVK